MGTPRIRIDPESVLGAANAPSIIGGDSPEEGFGPGKSTPRWVWVAKILRSLGPMHAQFDIGRHDEAAGPRVGIRGAEHLHNATRQGKTAGFAQPHKHEPGVGAGRESALVGEVEVLGDEEPAVALCREPDIRVEITFEALLRHGVRFVAERRAGGRQRPRQILVELDPHATFGRGGIGRSSSADAAAKATTARRSSAVMVG